MFALPDDLDMLAADPLEDERREAHEALTRDGEGLSTVDRLVSGGSFVLDTTVDTVPRWGTPAEVLWARGESLVIAGTPGVGKTTISAQVTAALVGLQGEVLGLPVAPARHVLYLAMDRPRQIARAMRRVFKDGDRAVLDAMVTFHRGPLPADLAKVPDQFVTLARKCGADVVIVDSLKDACAKLTDDEAGSMVNRAIQYANADDIDVLVLHHQRKGQNGAKPNTLADVYGSTWITAGAGSVVLLWGEAGSEVVEMVHLKQPADPVGPWTIEHDHIRGVSTVARAFDHWAYVNRHPGATVATVAQAEHGAPQKAGTAPYKRTARKLDRLVLDGKLRRVEGLQGLGGSFTAASYHPVIPDLMGTTAHRGHDRGHGEVTDD